MHQWSLAGPTRLMLLGGEGEQEGGHLIAGLYTSRQSAGSKEWLTLTKLEILEILAQSKSLFSISHQFIDCVYKNANIPNCRVHNACRCIIFVVSLHRLQRYPNVTLSTGRQVVCLLPLVSHVWSTKGIIG